MKHAILLVSLLAGACASQPAPRSSLTVTDYMRLQDAREQAFAAPTGQQSMWMNVLTGLGGTVTPTSDPAPAGARTCRQLQQVTRSIDGRLDDRAVTACRDGTGALSFDN